MARRVEEGDLAPVVLHLIGADVLRDPPGLGLDDRCLADRVEQRGLPVVDVAHDRDHRRPRGEILVRVVEVLGLDVLLGCVLDRDLAADLVCDQLDRLVRERLGDGDHLSQSHHDLDDLGHRDSESGRQLLDGRAGGNLHGTGWLDDFLGRRLRTRIALIARLPRVGTRTRRLLVDHDAPAAAADSALAGAYGSIWSVGAGIRHLSSLSVKPRQRGLYPHRLA
jgi:hypothetical protein